jgi:integrase
MEDITMANKKLNKNLYQDASSGVWYFQKKVRGLNKPYKFSLETTSGVRIGEGAALKWKRVDFKNRRVYIRKTLVRGEYKEPKTKSSIRYVHLLPIALKALQLHKKHTFCKSDFVFLNMKGKNIHQHSINHHVFKPTLMKAGLSTDRNCKDTRSSYITNAIDNNERLGFVQNQAGHTNTKMIIEHYYRHIPSADDRKGLDKAISEKITSENDEVLETGKTLNSTSILPDQ